MALWNCFSNDSDMTKIITFQDDSKYVIFLVNFRKNIGVIIKKRESLENLKCVRKKLRFQVFSAEIDGLYVQ